jgi:hypothetical protein
VYSLSPHKVSAYEEVDLILLSWMQDRSDAWVYLFSTLGTQTNCINVKAVATWTSHQSRRIRT